MQIYNHLYKSGGKWRCLRNVNVLVTWILHTPCVKHLECVLVSTEQAPEQVLRHNFLSTFGLAANQASKLGMSTNKSIICMYENFQVRSHWGLIAYSSVLKEINALLYVFINFILLIDTGEFYNNHEKWYLRKA